MNLPQSKLTKRQQIIREKTIGKEKLIVKIQHDDECGNGHNTFSITADYWEKPPYTERRITACGCMHEEVARFFPELQPYLKWHGCTTDGPLHYLANSLYHAKEIPEKQNRWYFYLEEKLIRIVGMEERDNMIRKYGLNAYFKDYPNPLAKKPDLEAARSCAIWPEAELEDFTTDRLLQRLPGLMAEFKSAVESLGLEY